MRVTKMFFIFLLSLFLLDSCYHMGNKDTSHKAFNELLGTYTMDLSHMGFSMADRGRYKNLQITFKNDSTFHLNMNVPFIYDSTGNWLPAKGGLEDWNWLFYKKNPNISTQFTGVWTKDSIFYLNSVTPQKGEQSINVIYFKKDKR